MEIPATGHPFGSQEGLAPSLARLLALILERGYTRRDVPFALSSGGVSYDYVDLRRAVARGDDLAHATEALLGYLRASGIEFDAIGGMTMGADPVAHLAAVLSHTSWFSVRKEQKQHGSRRRIEGASLDRASRVLLFEDTVSTGRSLLEAYDVVHSTGATVVLACTLLDRGESAATAFAKIDVPYAALLSYRDLGIEPIGELPQSNGATGTASGADR